MHLAGRHAGTVNAAPVVRGYIIVAAVLAKPCRVAANHLRHLLALIDVDSHIIAVVHN